MNDDSVLQKMLIFVNIFTKKFDKNVKICSTMKFSLVKNFLWQVFIKKKSKKVFRHPSSGSAKKFMNQFQSTCSIVKVHAIRTQFLIWRDMQANFFYNAPVLSKLFLQQYLFLNREKSIFLNYFLTIFWAAEGHVGVKFSSRWSKIVTERVRKGDREGGEKCEKMCDILYERPISIFIRYILKYNKYFQTYKILCRQNKKKLKKKS